MSKASEIIDLVKTNVFRITDPALITINPDEMTKQARKQVDAVDAANAAKNPPENNWLQELEELDRRLVGRMTAPQAKDYSDGEASKHRENVKGIEDEIAYVRSLLATPGLDRCAPLRMGRPPKSGDTCSTCLFHRKIEDLEIQLSRAKAVQQKSIRVCGAMVKECRELDKLRARWKELSKRASRIDTARKIARGLEGKPLNNQPVRTPFGADLLQPE